MENLVKVVKIGKNYIFEVNNEDNQNHHLGFLKNEELESVMVQNLILINFKKVAIPKKTKIHNEKFIVIMEYSNRFAKKWIHPIKFYNESTNLEDKFNCNFLNPKFNPDNVYISENHEIPIIQVTKNKNNEIKIDILIDENSN